MKKIFNLLLIFSLQLIATGLESSYAGTVTGKVSFNGTAPEAKKIDMAADPACAALHPEPLKTEEVVVNAEGALQNVFVYVKEGLEGKTFETATEAPVILDQKGCHYTPHVFGIQVGQPLEIINSDPTLHNVHAMPKRTKEFNVGMPIPGMKIKKKFEAPEIGAKFKCDVHPWMNAYANIVTHPFYGVSGDGGVFEIKNLPAGSYTLEAWHEKFGVQTQPVTVDETGTATVDFTFNG